MLSGSGKDWNQGSGIWNCVPEHQDVDKKEMGSTVEPWPRDWRNGPDVGSHAAVQNSPSSSCYCNYTFFFIKLIWLSLFSATVAPVASDEVLSPPSNVLSTLRDGSRGLLTWGLFSHFSGSGRCYSEHLGNLGCLLGWGTSLVAHGFAPWFKICILSLSQLFVPVLVFVRSLLLDDPFWDHYKGNQPFDWVLLNENHPG